MRTMRVIVMMMVVVMLVSGLPVAAAGANDGDPNLPRTFPELDTPERVPDSKPLEVRATTGLRATTASTLAARAGGIAAARTVFPPDDRVRVSPAVAEIVFIIAFDLNDDPLWTCTGSMIGPAMVATAGHCLYVPGAGWPANFLIVPGADGERAPYGVTLADRFAVPRGWSEAGDHDYDWGIMTLFDPIGNATGWLELGVMSSASLSSPDLKPFTFGYPGDKPFATQWSATKPALTGVTDTRVYTDLDAYQGQSGSPLVRSSDTRVFAIFSNEQSNANVATRIRQDMIDSMSTACANWGCTFSYWVEPVSNVPNPADAFARTWARTDQPVATGAVSRTWMWGPEPFGAGYEPYVESPGGQRAVIYLDKSRMEVTNPYGDQSSPWYVTNGLLVGEMVTGLLQAGDQKFEPRNPAAVNIAGDIDDTVGPMYSTFRGLLTSPALFPGQSVNQRVDRMGNVWVDPNMDWYGVTAAYLVEVPNLRHTVASPFWAFMNSSGLVFDGNSTTWAQLFENPFYATGYPIAEAYWATVKVGGTQHDVLIQCFQRRCLTYTPNNPDGWQVEAGNVGQHYYIWRYGRMP